MNNRPIKKYYFGTVVMSIWSNKTENGEYQTFSFERRYKDKEDNWQSTNSFRIDDLQKVAPLIEKVTQEFGIKCLTMFEKNNTNPEIKEEEVI